jgi:hypothetical protein
MRAVASLAFVVWFSVSPGVAQDAAKKVELSSLEKNGGANFGDWAVWNHHDLGPALLLVNQKTGYAIYLPSASNGWINFRTKDGAWMVLFSKGEPEAQDRKDLNVAQFLDKRPPVDLDEGKATLRDWEVKIAKDTIEFHNASYGDRLTISRTSGAFVHNARTIGDKK